METHPTEDHQHQAIQSATKAKITAVALAAFTAAKLTMLLIKSLGELLKKDPKEKDTVTIRMNGKTVYRGEFKDGVALKPKIDKLSEPQVAYLAAIVDAKQGQLLNSKTPVQMEVNGQRVFEALDGEVKTNQLPPGFAKAFTDFSEPIPVAAEEVVATKASIDNPGEQYMALSNCDLDLEEMKDAIEAYPKLGISLDQTVLENAREKGLANDDIKQILESSPYYSKMEREGLKPEYIDKRYLNPLLNGTALEKSSGLPQDAVAQLKGLGVTPETIQSIDEQTKNAGQAVSPIIVVQQQLQQIPKTSLRDQISSHLSRIAELPRKLIEQVKEKVAGVTEPVTKAITAIAEERKTNLMPQQLQVAQSIDFLSTRYGKDQENGNRSFNIGSYSMTRSKEGALDLSHKDRGSIFSLKDGQVKSSLTNADMGRFQKFKSNVLSTSRQGPAIEVG